MPPRSYSFRTPAHPLLQLVYFLIGGIVLIGAVLMGAVILAFAFGLAIVAGLVLMVRAWWLGRGRGPLSAGQGGSASGKLLEADYVVVEERDERDSRGS